MSTHRRIDAICAAVAVLTVVLTVLFMNGEALGIASAAGEDPGLFTTDDLNGAWDTSAATVIALSDSGSRITGSGAYVYNGDVYIVYPGHYVLTGGLTNGSVVVAASKTDQIWLSLDAVTLHCEDDAALRVEQAGKVFLTLPEGTMSTVSSGAEYSEETTGAGVDGAIYSRDDLTINGSGALEVRAAYQHGIVCNDDLVITGGDITISAVQDGIHAHDSVRVRDARLTISAGDDGITASNDDETAFLYIESGEISIPSCYEGLEAIEVTVAGGTLDIAATDDGINANGSGENSVIRITGGDISIINPTGQDADGLDSNGSIYIEGGTVFISVSDSGGNCALDYGSENGGRCIISGGTVIACGSGMMAEGFDSDSPQGFLMYDTLEAAGTTVALADASGQELLSAEIPCGFSSLVLSAPGMTPGDVCTLTVGDTQEQITIDNTSSSGFVEAGMFRGGMKGGGGPGGMPGGQEPEDMSAFPGQRDMTGWEERGDRTDLPAEGGTFDGGFGPRSPDGRGEDAGFPAGMSGGAAAVDSGSLILLAASCAVLLAGLLAAMKFKR